jgi:hypothetical protein
MSPGVSVEVHISLVLTTRQYKLECLAKADFLKQVFLLGHDEEPTQILRH